MKDSNESQTGTAFDPPIRIADVGRQIHVSVDLPGVTEEQIRIELEKTTCSLCIFKNGTMLRTGFEVPKATRFTKKKFYDGVLEIILEKPGP